MYDSLSKRYIAFLAISGSFAKVNIVSLEDSLPGILGVNIASEVIPNSSDLLFI